MAGTCSYNIVFSFKSLHLFISKLTSFFSKTSNHHHSPYKPPSTTQKLYSKYHSTVHLNHLIYHYKLISFFLKTSTLQITLQTTSTTQKLYSKSTITHHSHSQSPRHRQTQTRSSQQRRPSHHVSSSSSPRLPGTRRLRNTRFERKTFLTLQRFSYHRQPCTLRRVKNFVSRIQWTATNFR